MRVAVAPARCDAVDDEGRRDATVTAIEAAAGDGAALVVLPELSACDCRLSARHLVLRAEPGENRRTDAYDSLPGYRFGGPT